MRRLECHNAADIEERLLREWLVANGLGGYACGTVGGAINRRYHGLLISALPAPFGRFMTLSQLSERARIDGRRYWLTNPFPHETSGLSADAPQLEEFLVEAGLPVWRYRCGEARIEKRLVMPHQQNTTLIIYRRLTVAAPIRLTLMPWMNFRPHDALPGGAPPSSPEVRHRKGRIEVSQDDALPPLRLVIHHPQSRFSIQEQVNADVEYSQESQRGYPSKGAVWAPGYFEIELTEEPCAVIASTEDWQSIAALSPREAIEAETDRRRRLISGARQEAASGLGAELVLAADQFIIRPVTRVRDEARAHAAGDEARTIIAGYHWFTDWGRDTMISLEGLTLVTGRVAEAGYILRSFAQHIRHGLVPNYFPEGEHDGLYHTADASLWFFHALDRYLAHGGDRVTLESLLPRLEEMIAAHRAGTRFGIGVDPVDGLLTQGAPGFQLTWMDAKVGDWVVTPRRGKAVEINALWHQALRLAAQWERELGRENESKQMNDWANQVQESFNRRFWNERERCLLDVVDGPEGDDDAVRPNQIFAISLRYPALDRNRWSDVLATVRERLLTPRGLRTLDPRHPQYKDKYFGDLTARDAAYHQGTVWPWLWGHFLDAWLKTYPEQRSTVAGWFDAFDEHLSEACVGAISEIFDATTPHTPRGCVAQAWSVAEVLRTWVNVHPREVRSETTSTHG